MEPIRILHEHVMMDPGGIETQLMRIYRHIDRSKVQFDFLLHRTRKGAYDDEIRAMGGRIYYAAPFNPLRHTEYMNSMRRFFSQHPEYRIVIVHSDLALGPLKVASQAGVPWKISYSHNARAVWNLKRCFMDYERLFLKKYCDEMFAVSEVAARYTFGSRAVDAGQVRLIKNGITVRDYVFSEAEREAKRRELGLEDRFIVGHVGRLEQQKNHEFLLDVFGHLHELRPSAHLILIGEGGLEEKIRAKINRLGLQDAVTLLGRRADVCALVKAMDVMLLPSLWEGFPNVAIEAQAGALPIYMSQNVTAEADFSPYSHRLPLTLGAQAWAERIHGDMKEPVERADMSSVMREKGFDVEATAKWYEEFYIRKMEELLRGESAQAGKPHID